MSYRQDPAEGDPRGYEGDPAEGDPRDPRGYEGLHLPATGASDPAPNTPRKPRHTAARLLASPRDWQLSIPGHGRWLGAIEARRLDGDAVERLARLRRILPVLAEELARVRRDAAALRVENRRLLDRLHELERDLGGSAASAHAALRDQQGSAWPLG